MLLCNSTGKACDEIMEDGSTWKEFYRMTAVMNIITATTIIIVKNCNSLITFSESLPF
jgi:uncharacterized membrane protein